jgi:hypothetical protein
MSPKCIDLFCGLGGWSEAFIEEGYECIGYDIEAHDYGTGGYPGTLILRDVRSIHGSEFKDAAVIVASPPCQAYSYRAMPWSRAKALPPPDNTLFNECFRIQREASAAAGHHIPMIVENVRGAQKWVGRAQWHCGSFYLWGDVPALMPMTLQLKAPGKNWNEWKDWDGTEENKPKSVRPWGDATKVPGINWNDRSRPAQGFNVVAAQRYREGVKQSGISGARENGKGDKWFQDGATRHGSKSNSRKAASAMIAKIPFPLAQWVAQTFKPRET